jgi:IS5 family transposase
LASAKQLLRIHLQQQWYSFSDLAMEDALIEVPTMRRFAGIELISDRIPDETTILTFRHLLEKHGLGEQIFDRVKALVAARGVTMRQVTIVDAALIATPSSTSTRVQPECAGGDRTKPRRGIQKCIRWQRASSGSLECAATLELMPHLVWSTLLRALRLTCMN